MRIEYSSKNMTIRSQYKTMILRKFGSVVDKLLVDFDEEVKTARVTVDKDSRWGYEVSFNMLLPKKHQIYASSHERNLGAAIEKVREDIHVEIEKYLSTI